MRPNLNHKLIKMENTKTAEQLVEELRAELSRERDRANALQERVIDLQEQVEELNEGMTQFYHQKEHNKREALRLEGLLGPLKRKYDTMASVQRELKKLS